MLSFRPLLLAAALATASVAQAETNVWLLSPGFTVRELPVHLPNVNNLRFAPDGRLTALGYDGRIHLLSDTDGDGLEDTDTIFWDQPTLSVPVGMAWAADGLYVSSHGKVSRLRDTNGDGKADVEEIVASGWPPTDVGSGGVDASAVTLDPAGNVYFGLLTADYSNPYRVKDGVSQYELHGLRGTIQKWSAATKQLETLATGIRVPYTLAFNRAGDLFVTDQEGETWCPGGNPLDELNQIIPGRNYGFPPRHEKYLPTLVSEPPVVAFGPQHQSSCGFVFNESRAGQARFGPPAWEGDAFVAGESRGKIWRVQLAKTPAGYVGRETLFARLNLLTTDVAISPRGDLYVACHSGSPDWGTGPNGPGKLFKISYTNRNAPKPVATWVSDAMTLHVAFDQPVAPALTNRSAAMVIEFGEFVAAADRLEVLKPPYQVVQRQEATPRGKLRVVAARLSADRQTLTLTTDPHPQSVGYALTLPEVQAAHFTQPPAPVDLAYDLSGVEATWSAGAGRTNEPWHGWLPHLDGAVSAAFTAGSAEHEHLAQLLQRRGELRLRTQVILPAGPKLLHLEANAPFAMIAAGQTISARRETTGGYEAVATLAFAAGSEPLTVTLATGAKATPAFRLTYASDADPTARPLPFKALRLPWAPPFSPTPLLLPEDPALVGGDFENGRGLFFGEQLKCATCHRLRGEGATVGPDLSNLVHRDAPSVLRDIREPNATINPDYVAYQVRLRDGGELTGFVRAQTGETLRVAGADGREQAVRVAEVIELRPSQVSLMPTGLLDGLNAGQVRDLMTFLRSAPPTRSRADVEAVTRPTADAIATTPTPRALKLVLVASKQDHGPGQHDYPAWQKTWARLLGQAPGVTVTEAWEWPTREQWQSADALVFYFWNHDWSVARYEELDAFQKRGGGVVVFHAATIADTEPEKLAARLGLAAQPGPTLYRHTPLLLSFVAPTNHVLTHGFTSLNLLDEPYWPMFGDTNRIELLAHADVDGMARPLVWTFQNGPGRVFASVPGHYTWTWDDPLFRVLALRGIAWAAGEPPARLENLNPPAP